MLTFALGQEGFACDTAEDGLQAQTRLATHAYDLVVTDLRMPNMHGHSLAAEVLERPDRPVLVVHTSVDDPRLTKDLMERGVDDIMYKPAHYAAFAAKAKSLVGRCRQRRDAAANRTAGDSSEARGSTLSVFGRYQLIREVGCGAMATVYLARDTRLEREVALKVLREDAERCGGSLQRFQQEAKAAANLNHAGICPIYDVGEVGGRHYIAMAYVRGRTLSHFIQPDRRQPERPIAIIIRKLAQALQHAHERNVIHRDLKPSNILVSADGQPVITDFGLARRIDQAAIRLTHDGALVGTPAYMSPEQAGGEDERIGPASDIFSLGVILYELLTGRLPFEGSAVAVICQIMSKDPLPPSTYRDDLDERLERLCLSMLYKTIADRPPAMSVVANTLTEFLRHRERQLIAG
jgi:serine/threonine protein kinase